MSRTTGHQTHHPADARIPFFWVDPREDLIVLFLTQLLPSSAHPVRRPLRTLVYSAITAS
ncbi:hypothetical protein OKW30_005981 [Paraburkholderia sp. Clong3]|uniref:hypothetical protein n=1 Tax=unclassified Paraburkholderia TaxID=2615204 RepID=UPI001654C724|nr:hypothetical protein [Paraburkholderia sp. UCT31]MBC8740908.1 hypothetical protein [Paraburkholderia sp. UCT31]